MGGTAAPRPWDRRKECKAGGVSPKDSPAAGGVSGAAGTVAVTLRGEARGNGDMTEVQQVTLPAALKIFQGVGSDAGQSGQTQAEQ